MKNKHQIALLKACRIAGGQKQLAEKINVNPSRLNKWINRNKNIPFNYAFAIEKVTQGQVTCYELLPSWECFILYCRQLSKNEGISNFLMELSPKIYQSIVEGKEGKLSSFEKNFANEIIKHAIEAIHKKFLAIEKEIVIDDK